MATEVSAEFACGKILFGIRQSKLNYVLNETPYSAYITIRKKFTNGVIVNNEEMAKDASGAKVLESNLTKENRELKEKLKDVETICALIQIENEEFELKNDSLKKDIVSLDDKIEEAYLESRNLKMDIGKLTSNYNKVVEDLSEHENKAENFKAVIERLKYSEQKQEKNCREQETTIMMLENTLENRDQHVYKMEQEIKELEESGSVCINCDNKADEPTNLKKT